MIKTEKCSCGDFGCTTYWLVGIGHFIQGSGFTETEAKHIADLLNREPPPLDIDAILHKERPMLPRARLERRIVWNLINHVIGNGKFDLYYIYDGEQMTRVKTPKEAMELLFNLDEASLHFVATEYQQALTNACAMPKSPNPDDEGMRRNLISRAKEACDENEHGVYLVFGNDGWDCISDWNYHRDDADGFNALMEAFDPEAFV